jgi:hypothetical protein
MTTIARLFAIGIVLSCVIPGAGGNSFPPPSPEKKQTPEPVSKQIIGKWENGATGVEFLQGGGVIFYREGGKRIYRQRLYKFASPNRITIDEIKAPLKWVVKKITTDELVVTDASGHDQRFKRIKTDSAARKTPAAQCETNMRGIMVAEEQYMIDHAKYKPIGVGESFVKPGLLGKEPHCPSGGSYTVVIDGEGKLVVHCSVKEHDFGGRGLR